MVGLYVPGESHLHQIGASPKLLGLLVLGLALITTHSIPLLAVLACSIGLTFVLGADLGVKRFWQSTRPLLIWIVFIALAQAFFASTQTAIVIVLRLLALVWAASMITYTTRLTDMTDSLVRVCGWLRPLGVSPNRVAFMVALTVRLIPALSDIVREVRDAQRARGVERSVVATVVPVLTRVFQKADGLSDALNARGYEQWDDLK